MILSIPIPEQPHSEQSTLLSGVSCILRFDYVQRAGFWRLGLYTSGGDPIVLGISLVAGVDLLSPYRSDPRVPEGGLWVMSQTDPGRDSWARTAWLLYLEPTETEAGAAVAAAFGGGGGGGGEPVE